VGDYILVLDIGTTNIKAFLFDRKGDIISEARRRPRYIMDEPGQVEQDPKELWDMSKEAIEEVLQSQNLKATNIDSMAISTQRASFCLWNKKTGQLYSNIITWQDKRAAQYVKKLHNKLFFRILRAIGKIARIFGSTKMLTASILQFITDYASVRTSYFIENHPEIKKEIKDPNTDIIWGQIDTWILWNLTEGKKHITDYSNAGSSACLDPFTLKWNKAIIGHMNIPTHILPEILDTNGDFGVTRLFGEGEIPIRAVIADQQASLFGQCCFDYGEMKVTNGTGSFVDLNTGDKAYASKRKLYPLVAWRMDGNTTYMLEGFSHNTGNIIDWIQSELHLIDTPSDSEKLALSVDSTEGVYFLPTLTSGISFPYWDSTARGNLFGVNLSTKKEHIIRAVLEGICLRIKDFVTGIIDDTKIEVKRIKADGGVSENKFILQFLSDILGLEVEHSTHPETTALGAAFMAGLKTGFWNSKEDLRAIRKIDKVYTPQMSEEERQKKYSFWKNIIQRSLNYDLS
jgi:glycerol kinase